MNDPIEHILTPRAKRIRALRKLGAVRKGKAPPVGKTLIQVFARKSPTKQ